MIMTIIIVITIIIVSFNLYHISHLTMLSRNYPATLAPPILMTAVCLKSEKSDEKYTHSYPAPHFSLKICDAANDANDDNDYDEDDEGEQLDRKAGIEGMGFPPLEDIIHALGTVAVSSKNNCSNNLTIVSIFIANF